MHHLSAAVRTILDSATSFRHRQRPNQAFILTRVDRYGPSR